MPGKSNMLEISNMPGESSMPGISTMPRNESMNWISNTNMKLHETPNRVGRTLLKWVPCFLIMLASIATLQHAHGQTARSQGYVNLRSLGDLDDFFASRATVEVNVEAALMRMVEAASRQEDPELADLLARLDGVFVLGYELKETTMDQFDQLATDMGNNLADDGWTVVMRTRDIVENTHFYVRLEGDGVTGMVVISVEAGSDQAVFVNIVGDIDPEQIGRIGQKFQIQGMREL
jgi:hypothetical protein